MSTIALPLVPKQIDIVLQDLTMRALDIDPMEGSQAYAAVRVGWQSEGQPGWRIDEDVCIFRCYEEDSDYNRIRDRRILFSNDPTLINAEDSYTRTWRFLWTFYGPNSADRARIVRSWLFSEDSHEQLSDSNLYLVTDVSAPRRVPELFSAQWWERVDLEALFNEAVLEVPQLNPIRVADVIVVTDRGYVDDVYFESSDVVLPVVYPVHPTPDGTVVAFISPVSLGGGEPVWLNSLLLGPQDYRILDSKIICRTAPELGDIIRIYAGDALAPQILQSLNAPDGVTRKFNFASVLSDSSLIFWNGQCLTYEQYVTIGLSVSLNFVPQAGDTVLAYTGGTRQLRLRTVTPAPDGINTLFTSPVDLNPQSALVLINGYLETTPGNYVTIGKRTIQFNATPQVGDSVRIYA